MTGQMPFIFYTNGYTTWLWDYGNYAPRKVYSVFSKQDLQRLMDRKSLQKSFRQLNINPAITNRYYQAERVQMVDLDFLAKVCCVFGCEISDLLEYCPQPETRPENE